jgi:hypothetical protein
MNENDIAKMKSIGFNLIPHDDNLLDLMGDSLWFENESINPADLKVTLEKIAPNHFKPNSNHRGVFVGHIVHSTTDFWYFSSYIRGTYRGYRCKNSYDWQDAGHVGASDVNLSQAVDKFVQNYKDRIGES